MTRSLMFTIPGEPMGKVRARATRGRLFNHPANVFYEGMVRDLAHDAMKGSDPFSGPVVVRLGVCMTPPASWSKARQAAALGGWAPAKPDLDNIAKIVTDAMNGDKTGHGRVYLDDKQIVKLFAVKRYAEESCVHVNVEELP